MKKETLKTETVNLRDILKTFGFLVRPIEGTTKKELTEFVCTLRQGVITYHLTKDWCTLLPSNEKFEPRFYLDSEDTPVLLFFSMNLPTKDYAKELSLALMDNDIVGAVHMFKMKDLSDVDTVVEGLKESE